jgi:hypothetical protein
VPGNAANQDLLKTIPISFTVAGGGTDEPIEALKECARLGLGDFVALLKAFLHVLDYANTPGDPTPSVLDLTVDMDGDGSPETQVTGTVSGGDFSDGMQVNEVALFTWTSSLNQQQNGSGYFSFVKLSDDNTFRATIVTADPTFDMEPGCGPFVVNLLGLAVKPNLAYPSMWSGDLGCSTSVDAHTLDAYVTFTNGAQSATLTGTTDGGTPVEMEIPFDSL